MSTFENIAENLKKLCQQKGWSQEDLARELGVSFATVNRWENGKTKPSHLAQEKIRQVANMGKRNQNSVFFEINRGVYDIKRTA